MRTPLEWMAPDQELQILRDAARTGRMILGPLADRPGPVEEWNATRAEEADIMGSNSGARQSRALAHGIDEDEHVDSLTDDYHLEWGGPDPAAPEIQAPLTISTQLRGSSIAAVLEEDHSAPPRLHLSHVRIVGSVNVLEGQRLESFHLSHCEIQEGVAIERRQIGRMTVAFCELGHGELPLLPGKVTLRGCRAQVVEVTDTMLAGGGAASLIDTEVERDLEVSGCEAYEVRAEQCLLNGGVVIHHNTIHGQLTLAGSTLSGKVALDAGSDVCLRDTEVQGAVTITHPRAPRNLGQRTTEYGATIERTGSTVDLSGLSADRLELILPQSSTKAYLPDRASSPHLVAGRRPHLGEVTLTLKPSPDASTLKDGGPPSFGKPIPPRAMTWSPPTVRQIESLLGAGAPHRRFHPELARALGDLLASQDDSKAATDLYVLAANEQLKRRSGFLRTPWRWVKLATIGHGYKLHRAFFLLLAVWAIATVVVSGAATEFRPSGDAPPSAPGFWGWLYALDVVVAPIGTGQSELWIASAPWLVAAIWVLKILAWGLLALFIAGLAGWVNRDARRPAAE